MTSLPMLGYMEQSVSTALIKAMTACGNDKPKYPFLSASRSALFYIAYHLKGKLPKFYHTCRSVLIIMAFVRL